MERFLLFVALGCGMVFGQGQPVTGSLTGKVVDATTKAGIRKATVYATMQGPPPVPGEGVRFAQPTIYSASTDDGGVYRFAALPLGQVDLRAEKAGHLPRPAVRRERITIRAGEETTGGELELLKQAVIAGRVTDLDGEPVEQVSVMAIPSRRTRTPGYGGVSQGMTDDRGEFRLPRLAGGSYKLLATKPTNNSATAIGVPGEPVLVNAPTFFPSVLDEASASEVTVGSGEERTGVEIRLRKTGAVRVSGRVTGEIGTTQGISVALHSTGMYRGGMARGFAGMTGNWNVMAGADGRFTLLNVVPGEYVAMANGHRGAGNTNLSGSTKLRVGQQDVDQFVIQMQPVARITGKVIAEGSAKLPYPQINVSLASAEPGLPGGGGGMVKPDGTFLIENMQRTRLRLNQMAPRGWYLKAVSVGGQRQPGLEFDLTGGDTPIELIFSDKPGAVEVTVEGLTEESPFRVAMALPEGAVGNGAFTNLYRSVPVRPGQSAFKIEDVPPGNYHIFVGAPGMLEALGDPAVWERVKSKTVAVKVEEGVTVPAAPRLIVESDVDEK